MTTTKKRTVKQITEMFQQINVDVADTGEEVVALCKANADYYIEQMQNLEFSEGEINAFIASLDTL